ncbi:MAG: folate-binding protein [Pseudomonadota bacterium]
MFLHSIRNAGLLVFSGDDAQSFLHAQLTSDVAGLALSKSQYSGYCTPKGRLLASFLLWRNESGYVLQLPAVLREPIQKRMSMYVLRSKVKVADASNEYARMGISGDGAAQALNGIAGNVPKMVHDVVHSGGMTMLKLPADRYEIVVLRTHEDRVRAALAAHAEAADAGRWDWLDIRAGIATILPATQEEFVPQMVNFDAIGAVSFNKGCYPGQEIVARMHFLGKLKQRMVLAHIANDVAPRPGDKLYSADFGDQASGMIANAAPATAGGHDVLAVIQTTSMNAQPVHLNSPDGPPLELLPLPY